MRAQCVALWTMQLLITSATISLMGQLLPLALLQARGEHIGLNAIMHSYLTPDLPKYSCLSFFSSVSLEPLIPVGPIILLYAISVHGCHTFHAIWPTHVFLLSTFNHLLPAKYTSFLPSLTCPSHVVFLEELGILRLPTCTVPALVTVPSALPLEAVPILRTWFSSAVSYPCTYWNWHGVVCVIIRMALHVCIYILGQSSVVDLLTT